MASLFGYYYLFQDPVPGHGQDHEPHRDVSELPRSAREPLLPSLVGDGIVPPTMVKVPNNIDMKRIKTTKKDDFAHLTQLDSNGDNKLLQH